MNRYSHPVKFYMYLAAGLRVISTSIPSILEYKNRSSVFIADTAKDMFHIIKNTKILPLSLQKYRHNQQILDTQSVKQKINQIINYISKTDK